MWKMPSNKYAEILLEARKGMPRTQRFRSPPLGNVSPPTFFEPISYKEVDK
jgi:hypothetical protein